MSWLQIHKESEPFVDKLAQECLTDKEKENFLLYGILPENRWQDTISDEVYKHIQSCSICRLKLRILVEEETEISQPTVWDRIIKGVHESFQNEEKRVIEKVKELIIDTYKEKKKKLGEKVKTIFVRITPDLADEFFDLVGQPAFASDFEGIEKTEMPMEIDGQKVNVKIQRVLDNTLEVEIQ